MRTFTIEIHLFLELLYSQNTAERKELSTLAADISVEYNNVFTTMSPEAQFPAGG